MIKSCLWTVSWGNVNSVGHETRALKCIVISIFNINEILYNHEITMNLSNIIGDIGNYF